MKTIRSLDHVAIAVRDTDAALGYFRDRLGLPVVADEENEAACARLTYLDAGNAMVQLVAPLSDAAPIAHHLAELGEGIHHLCFGVEDVVTAAARLAASDVDQVRLGSGRGRPSAFLPGPAVHGARIEVTAIS